MYPSLRNLTYTHPKTVRSSAFPHTTRWTHSGIYGGRPASDQVRTNGFTQKSDMRRVTVFKRQPRCCNAGHGSRKDLHFGL